MHNPITVLTDKVMQTMKSMVYLAMRMSHAQDISAAEIARYLSDRIPGGAQYHEGLVEGVLQDLHRDGRVGQTGMRWYPIGASC